MNAKVLDGGIYGPGWHVTEEVGERHWRVLATFEEHGDAEEFLAQVLEDDDERRISENELKTCCQGKNINCGHHYGR